ncbi:hypothetical protein HPP92_016616 [Vanilla planifolia]|uniref:Uncharacterized protein n=1 Tax=Vanilla planifolia TaxID=51239 RepID=A0A835QF47_VANPL|nr:hypothetical protein HPP92_016616 [Vanilla planifolia]
MVHPQLQRSALGLLQKPLGVVKSNPWFARNCGIKSMVHFFLIHQLYSPAILISLSRDLKNLCPYGFIVDKGFWLINISENGYIFAATKLLRMRSFF